VNPITRNVLVRTDGRSRLLALMNHCTGCGPCNADTSQPCPEARRLWQDWSRREREVRS
jgi:hypothetical protein